MRRPSTLRSRSSLRFRSLFRHACAIAGTLPLLWPSLAQALVFGVSFDDTPDGSLDTILTGTGVIRFDGDPGDGSFAQSSLSNLEMTFDFGGDVFTLADVRTPEDELLVDITTEGLNRRLYITNVNGSGSGPNGGAMDFENLFNSSELLLSFEPAASGDTPTLYFTDSFFGDYVAISSIPEPATMLLVGAGLAGLGLAGRHRGSR